MRQGRESKVVQSSSELEAADLLLAAILALMMKVLKVDREGIITLLGLSHWNAKCALQDKEAAVVEDCLSLHRAGATKNKLLLKSVRARLRSGLNRNSCD